MTNDCKDEDNIQGNVHSQLHIYTGLELSERNN